RVPSYLLRVQSRSHHHPLRFSCQTYVRPHVISSRKVQSAPTVHCTGQCEEKAPQRKSLQSLIFTQSGRRDLNPRPPEPHSGALPDCATSRYPTPETPPREQSTDARRTDAPRLSARLTRIYCSSKPTLQPLRVRGLIPQLQGLNLLRA